MSDANALLALTLATPLGMLLACLWPRARQQMFWLLAAAPLPAGIAALAWRDQAPLFLGGAGPQVGFALDLPGAILLGVAALLWIAAGAYATTTLRGQPQRGRFAVCWLATWMGCAGVFLAADLLSFYFLLAVLSVGAAALVVHDETAGAWRAGAVYLGLALLAEALLLGGFVLAAGAIPGDSLLIRDAAIALVDSPWRDATLGLLIAGFAIKAGLVPLHFWMPLAYGSAPIPAAAVLSGAVVKASLLGLIRFLPPDVALPVAGAALASAGLFAAYYGVAVGITQQRPALVLAYSSASQMGFLLALVGMGLREPAFDISLAAAFYAAHHVLVKGALFLAVGVIAATGARRMRPLWLPAVVIALGLGGLPGTGGVLAKSVAKSAFGDGAASWLAAGSSAATTLLMWHFARRLAASIAPEPNASAPAFARLTWLLMAAAALALPWALYLGLPLGRASDLFTPAALAEQLAPVALGTLIAFGWMRSGVRLPQLPEGDLGFAALGRLLRASVAASAQIEHVDTWLRRWPIASVTLVVIGLLFAAVLLQGS